MTAIAQFSGPIVDWTWIGANSGLIWTQLVQHLVLTAIAIGVGFGISLPLAIIAARWRMTYGPITWISALLFTIPSIALFALLIPITGLTMWTAEIGLVSYTLLILIENIVTGVDSVPPPVLEAADGVGYGPWRRFRDVELPLATPAIVAGLRVATVTTVGLVTVTALIGYGGLGAIILLGLQNLRLNEIVVGSVLSVLLAAILDLALAALERSITPWRRGSGSARPATFADGVR